MIRKDNHDGVLTNKQIIEWLSYLSKHKKKHYTFAEELLVSCNCPISIFFFSIFTNILLNI